MKLHILSPQNYIKCYTSTLNGKSGKIKSKQQSMKKLITFLTLLPSLVMAQLTTINPDTVCYQSSGSIYEVQNTAGLIYNWTVTAPGIITGGQGTNQIQVDWSAAPPGLITNGIQVQASNSIGCLSPVSLLNVFIYDVNITYTQLADMCETEPCVNLVGSPVGGIWSGPGLNAGQFCPDASGVGIFNLTYSYTNAGCTFSGTVQVNVLPIPVLLPIGHN